MSEYEGKERRNGSSGRRGGDTCAQHCMLVKQWEEQRAQHKEDKKSTDDRIRSFAPLWSVILLIGIVISSVTYTFVTSTSIQEKIAVKMEMSNKDVTNKLADMATNQAINNLKLAQVIRLLEKHIEKFGIFPGAGIGADEKFQIGKDKTK